MLKLSKHHYLSLPDFGSVLPHSMHLESVVNDSDALTQAILHDPIDHDDNWELVERPDMRELTSYWEQVEHDLLTDPEWQPLSNE